MSNETEETEEGEKRERTIYIKHEGLPNAKGNKGESELEKTKEELESMKNVVALMGLKEFESERSKLLELVPTDKKEELEEFCDTPEKLETLKKIYNPSEEEETNTKAPSGKATLGIRTPSETPSFDAERGYSDPMIQKISDLYDIIGDTSGKVSASDKLKAERTLDNLYFEMRKGLKDRRDKGLSDYVYPKTGRFGWNCQNCGKTNQTSQRAETGVPCKFCGYRFGVDPVPTHPFS